MKSLCFRIGVVLCMLATVVTAGAASAQGAACDRASLLAQGARERLVEGEAAQARDLLRRAVTLCPSVPLRFNLALALRATGAPTEASQLLEQLASEDITEAQGEAIARLQSAVSQQTSTLRVRVEPLEGSEARVEVDGIPEGRTSPEVPLVVTVDPGIHRVLGATDSARGFTDVEVAAGDSENVLVRLTAFTDEEGGPWLWIGVVGGVVAAGALAAVIGVAVTDSAWPGDEVTGVTTTLLAF